LKRHPAGGVGVTQLATGDADFLVNIELIRRALAPEVASAVPGRSNDPFDAYGRTTR
jgi:hypothetical protein